MAFVAEIFESEINIININCADVLGFRVNTFPLIPPI